jgi:2-methylisocitrate lyase-like PEP mutase family enzyme
VAEVAEAADIEVEIDMDSGYGSHPCRRREVANCEDSEERVAA